MYFPRAYDTLTSDKVEAMRAAGIDLTPIENSRKRYVRRPRGKQLHASNCKSIAGIPVVDEKVNRIELTAWTTHDQCNRWRWSWDEETTDYLSAALILGTVEEAIVAVEAQTTPTRVIELLEVLDDDDVEEATDRLSMSDWVHSRRARLKRLQAGISAGKVEERLRPFTVGRLAMPAASSRVAGLKPGNGTLPTLHTLWEQWQEAIEEGKSNKDARALVQRNADTLLGTGIERLEKPMDVDAALSLWERTLKAACKGEQAEVYYALSIGGYEIDDRPGQALRQVRALYPHAQKKEGWSLKAVVRVPETVAWWLADRTRGTWLGEAGDEGHDVLETAVALWSNDNGPLGKPAGALEAAKLV